MTDLYDLATKYYDNYDTELSIDEISDKLDYLTDTLYYYPKYRALFRKICEQVYVIDPDDVNQYQYDKDKYDKAWNTGESRWYNNIDYQPVDNDKYEEILTGIINSEVKAK